MRYQLIIFAAMMSFSCNQQKQADEVKKYSIDQFYNNLRINGGVFSPDETKLLVSSDKSGIFNLYEISLSDGSMQAVTKSSVESYFAIDYVHGTNQILYSADKGGNELSHIYLLEDSTAVDLTFGEKEKANFVRFSSDNTKMYYLSNKRDARFFDLYKMKIGVWKEEIIYKNDENLNFSGISEDENLIALTKTLTTSENQLFLFDKTTKKKTEISNPNGPGTYQASGFSKNGQFFYFITNSGKDFSYLAEYEISTGKTKIIYETNWDVMYSFVSRNEKFRVIGINVDGKNNLIVLDNKSDKKIDFPEIPDGDIQSISISKSEKLMRLTVGSSKAPGNIYVYYFETKELKKLSETLNPEINPNDLVNAEVIRYKSFDGLEIPAIYYKPLTASKTNKVPALVWVHGGPGGQSRTGYFSLIQFLVNQGYAVLAVNNRGSSGYGKTFHKLDNKNHGVKDLQDCIFGKKWLQQQDYIDTSKIGIIGGSYGGYMTMAAMTFTPNEFKVGVNIFGVTNWLRTLKSIPPYWESQRKALYDELGDPFSDDSIRLHAISPLFHASKVKNPVLVLQGANDPRVLQVESDEMVEAIRKNNVPVEYIVFHDEGHGFIKKENEIKGYGQILVFLDKFLKGALEIEYHKTKKSFK